MVSEQAHLLCREMPSPAVSSCRHADGRGLDQGDNTSLRPIVGKTLDQTSKLAGSCQIIIEQMGWLHGEVDMGIQQRNRRPCDLVDNLHTY